MEPRKGLLSSPDMKKVSDHLFVRYTRDQIQEVITDLYKDPANAFICTLDMFFLARDKIEGKDITKGTMEARRKAIETHEMKQKSGIADMQWRAVWTTAAPNTEYGEPATISRGSCSA